MGKEETNRGELIDSYDYDDGRLTFVKKYAKIEDGALKIECYIDRYGETRAYEGDHDLTEEGTKKLRDFLNRKVK